MTRRYDFLEGKLNRPTPPKTAKPASLTPPTRPNFPFQPVVLSHKDPSIKYQTSLAGLKGKQYVDRHNALHYYYGYGHRGGDCHCYSKTKKS